MKRNVYLLYFNNRQSLIAVLAIDKEEAIKLFKEQCNYSGVVDVMTPPMDISQAIFMVNVGE